MAFLPERLKALAWGGDALKRGGYCKIVPMNRYRAWVVCLAIAAGNVAVLLAAKGDPAKGKQVFEQCSMCHNADSTEKKFGPGLKGLFKREKLADGKKATEANIRARIDEGGGQMPSFKDVLDDQQKDDLIAYLKTL